MKNVLILTHEDDPHSESVKSYLNKIGVSFFEVLTDKLIGNYELSFSSKHGFVIADNQQEVVLDTNWNIWNRRLMDPVIPDSIPKKLHDIIFTETEKTWQGLLFSHEGKVVNRPSNNFLANNKLDQMLFTKRHNSQVTIPDTLVTNNPSLFEKFYASHEVVSFKHQKSPLIKEGEDYLTTYNTIVTSEHAKQSDLLVNYPALFQQYVDKKYELRITVTDSAVVPVRIDSQNVEISKEDFRRYDFDNVTYSLEKIPSDVEKFCFDIVRHYGLHFAQIDMIYSKEKEYVFLEVNPNGQWLWCEQLSGVNLTKYVGDNLL